MRTTQQDAIALVTALARSTNKQLDEETFEHFVRVLQSLAPDTSAETVRRLQASDRFWPSEARIRTVAAQVIADLSPPLPTPEQGDLFDVHPDVLRANIAALRLVQSSKFQEALREGMGPDASEHEMAEAVAAAVYQFVLERTGREPFPDPSTGQQAKGRRVYCAGCRDTGWVEHLDQAGILSVEPCERCRPVEARRWREGHYRLGHDCEECRAVRRKGRSALETTETTR